MTRLIFSLLVTHLSGITFRSAAVRTIPHMIKEQFHQTMSLVGVARLHLAPAWGRCVVMYVVSVFHPLRSVKMEEHEKHGSPFSRWSFTQAFRFNVEPLNRKQHSQQGEFIVRRYCFIVYLFVFYKRSLSLAAQPFVHKQTESLKWSFSKPLI